MPDDIAYELARIGLNDGAETTWVYLVRHPVAVKSCQCSCHLPEPGRLDQRCVRERASGGDDRAASTCATRGGRWESCGSPAGSVAHEPVLAELGPRSAPACTSTGPCDSPPGRSFPTAPGGDLVQAGPMLVSDGPVSDGRSGPRGFLRRADAVRLRHHGGLPRALRARPEPDIEAARRVAATDAGPASTAGSRLGELAGLMMSYGADSRRSTWTVAAPRCSAHGGREPAQHAPTRTRDRRSRPTSHRNRALSVRRGWPVRRISSRAASCRPRAPSGSGLWATSQGCPSGSMRTPSSRPRTSRRPAGRSWLPPRPPLRGPLDLGGRAHDVRERPRRPSLRRTDTRAVLGELGPVPERDDIPPAWKKDTTVGCVVHSPVLDASRAPRRTSRARSRRDHAERDQAQPLVHTCLLITPNRALPRLAGEGGTRSSCATPGGSHQFQRPNMRHHRGHEQRPDHGGVEQDARRQAGGQDLDVGLRARTPSRRTPGTGSARRWSRGGRCGRARRPRPRRCRPVWSYSSRMRARMNTS